jgi:AcrR family transcriptional regulator
MAIMNRTTSATVAFRANPQPFYVQSGDAPAKQKILVAALKLFVRDGLCETSIRDIARESGFSNPALFKHFKSKDSLADFLFERCYLNLFYIVARAIKSKDCFSDRQRAAIGAYMKALDEDAPSVLYVQDSLRHFWPRMPAAARKHSILAEVQRMLKAGQAEGAVTREIDVELLTTAWVGTLQQFARVRHFGHFAQPTAVLSGALEGLLMRMVQK